MRAYAEINDFEEQLRDAGVIVVKFWLAIDKDTQLERFQAREQIPFKRFKITEDDWRNRDKWDAYRAAVGDMVDRTSTEIAPGPWWRPTTSAGRGSRYCAPSTWRWKRRSPSPINTTKEEA